jgi:hypothetical protein
MAAMKEGGFLLTGLFALPILFQNKHHIKTKHTASPVIFYKTKNITKLFKRNEYESSGHQQRQFVSKI